MFWLTLLLFATNFVPQTPIAYRQPQLAASGDTVAVTFGAEHAIYFAVSGDAGKNWTGTARVAEPGMLSLGNHRGPRVVISGSVMVISAIAGKQGGGKDGDLLSWRSLDGGKTWREGATINDVPGAPREGLHAMAASPDGHLFATWLDLRNFTPGKPGTELWGAYSSDAGATWSKNVLVYKSPSGTICQCCHPSAMFSSDGTLEVMWRNEVKGNRDMFLTRSKDGGRTFGEASKLGVGSWTLNACPMDGGGLAQTADGKTVAVWRRENKIYTSSEQGAETLLHEGKNPSLAVGKAGLYAAWSSPDGVWAHVPGHAEPVQLDQDGGFVILTAISKGGVLAAWERKGTIQFHTLP
jgi:hypothetical protein